MGNAILTVRGGLLAAAVLAAAGCSTPAPRYPTGELLRFDAQVTRVDLEGGFWGLVTEDGTRYDPTGLPRRFHLEGMRVHVIAKPLRGATTRMWGQPIRLVTIRAAE